MVFFSYKTPKLRRKRFSKKYICKIITVYFVDFMHFIDFMMHFIGNLKNANYICNVKNRIDDQHY